MNCSFDGGHSSLALTNSYSSETTRLFFTDENSTSALRRSIGSFLANTRVLRRENRAPRQPRSPDWVQRVHPRVESGAIERSQIGILGFPIERRWEIRNQKRGRGTRSEAKRKGMMEGEEQEVQNKSRVVKVDSKETWDSFLSQASLVVVHFTASWCIPSVAMNPFFEELTSSFSDVLFLSVDVDDVKDVASRMEIKAMPTFLIIKDGAPVDKLVGANPEELKKRVDLLCTVSPMTIEPSP
ncbi:hypothetical protein MLD38_019380 [Melastoma candidum]|uniref:Uncharacterized protein n=1 Tax=Melastoma candidum TaxID=119954 RepID=A0ACB9QYP9_9MYRT|nr:hypothetical protein MLD38_019380 [Melastoma candidum]